MGENKEVSKLGLVFVIVAFLLVWGSIILLLVNGNSFKSEIYTITFYDDFTPGSSYKLTIINKQVEITRTHFCSALDCVTTTDDPIKYNYSNSNALKLMNFIKNDLKANKNEVLELHKDQLTDYQQDIMMNLILGEYNFELAVEEYDYRIEYSYVDDTFYDIYLKNDNSIVVKKSSINKNYDITKVDTYNLNFSDNNMKLVREYILKQAKKEDSKIVYISSILIKDEKPIMKSIINNDENYLKDLIGEARLNYIISYSGINCLTPTLYLYDDNTYEYYYTFSTNNKITPKTGKYNIDIDKIINNSKTNNDYDLGIYTIEDIINDKSYNIDVNNTDMRNLLDEINVSLQSCLVQQ